jgi:hypothetical protein
MNNNWLQGVMFEDNQHDPRSHFCYCRDRSSQPIGKVVALSKRDRSAVLVTPMHNGRVGPPLVGMASQIVKNHVIVPSEGTSRTSIRQFRTSAAL